jgi:predicted aspartyl protease
MAMRRLLIAACALLAPSLAAAATCTVAKLTTVPATLIGPKVYLPITMNEATGLFLLDTGSAETLVNTAFGAEAGVNMDRRAGEYTYRGAGNKETLPVFKGHVRITHIGDIHYQDWEYGIVDLGGVAPDGHPLGGLLGMDFMHYFDVEVDFVARTVSIYRLNNCTDMHPPSWSGDYDAIPLKHTPSHTLTLPVFLDNADLDMEFDTGAGNVLVSRDAASKAGVDETALAHDAAVEGRGIAGQFAVAKHRFKLLLIGSGVYPDVNLPIENERSVAGETDGLVGLAAFKAKRVWISFSTNTLFVQGAPKLPGK